MFWKKKSDGFDWHKHVRTTIKLRREDRRRRIDEIKDAAADGIKGAGKASLSASSSGFDALNKAVTAPFAWLGTTLSSLIGAAAGATTTLLRGPLTPIGKMLERRGVAPLVALTAAVSGLLGLGRGHAGGWDHLAIGMVVGSVALWAALLLPPLIAGRGPRLVSDALAGGATQLRRIPGAARLPLITQRAIAAAVLFALIAGGSWLAVRGAAQLPSTTLAGLPGIPGVSRPYSEGRATALSGGHVRLNGQILQLAGIDPPELDQQCGGQAKERRWTCGRAAQSALQDMIRGKQVRCDLGGAGESGITLATCKIGERDVAADLVARGHVFAEAGIFASTYGRFEQDARNAKLGLWRGSAERPQEYRTRLWETAKKAAPDGCPIKGHVTSGARVYVVPWASEYGRVRVRQERGGRWFCSEREAIAAGWKPVERS